jgi:hypothetical protein
MRKFHFFQWLTIVLAGLTMGSCQKVDVSNPTKPIEFSEASRDPLSIQTKLDSIVHLTPSYSSNISCSGSTENCPPGTYMCLVEQGTVNGARVWMCSCGTGCIMTTRMTGSTMPRMDELFQEAHLFMEQQQYNFPIDSVLELGHENYALITLYYTEEGHSSFVTHGVVLDPSSKTTWNASLNCLPGFDCIADECIAYKIPDGCQGCSCDGCEEEWTFESK